MLSCSFSYLDQLSTVVFKCAKIVMLMFVCIVKRDGMRPTPVSIEIICFSLDFVVTNFIDHGIFIFYGISSIKEVRCSRFLFVKHFSVAALVWLIQYC